MGTADFPVCKPQSLHVADPQQRPSPATLLKARAAFQRSQHQYASLVPMLGMQSQSSATTQDLIVRMGCHHKRAVRYRTQGQQGRETVHQDARLRWAVAAFARRPRSTCAIS